MSLRLCLGVSAILLGAGCPAEELEETEPEGTSYIGIVTEVAYCPVIESVAVLPLEAWLGATLDVRAKLSDGGDPSIEWTATSGSFAADDELETKYRCFKPGEHTITLTIERDSFCEDNAEVEVTCIESPRCGDDVLDPEENCDDGNTDSDDGCSPLCITEVD